MGQGLQVFSCVAVVAVLSSTTVHVHVVASTACVARKEFMEYLRCFRHNASSNEVACTHVLNKSGQSSSVRVLSLRARDSLEERASFRLSQLIGNRGIGKVPEVTTSSDFS